MVWWPWVVVLCFLSFFLGMFVLASLYIAGEGIFRDDSISE